MSARAVLREAADRGVKIGRSGALLDVVGPVDVIEELRPRIVAAKADLLAILAEDSEVALVALVPAPIYRADAIIAATMAENLARAVANRSGWLCARCHKIGLVDTRGVCTYCVEADAK